MVRNYKLAANFNTVEFEITNEDLLEVLNQDEFELNEYGEYEHDVPEEELIKRVLQREYDILAGIKVVNIAPDIKQAKQIDPPSEKQAAFAESLGMKDPMKHSKKEVWEYIQKHKDKK
jgi:hypothetical protein